MDLTWSDHENDIVSPKMGDHSSQPVQATASPMGNLESIVNTEGVLSRDDTSIEAPGDHSNESIRGNSPSADDD